MRYVGFNFQSFHYHRADCKELVAAVPGSSFPQPSSSSERREVLAAFRDSSLVSILQVLAITAFSAETFWTHATSSSVGGAPKFS
jgi:hypothetical protein